MIQDIDPDAGLSCFNVSNILRDDKKQHVIVLRRPLRRIEQSFTFAGRRLPTIYAQSAFQCGHRAGGAAQSGQPIVIDEHAVIVDETIMAYMDASP